MNDGTEIMRRRVLAIARDCAREGVPLPGEHELARRVDANRPSVRRVLAQLEQQGIVHRHQGAATTVDPIALRMTVRLEEQLEHSILLDRLGYEPTVALLDAGRGLLGIALADQLERPADSPVLRARKRWTADGRAAMLADNTLVLPADAPESVDASRSAFDVIAELWQEPILWEVATPGVENIADPHAELLGLEPGAACMTLTIVGMLRSGSRVFHAVEHHHPEIVQYSVVRRFPEPWA